MEQKPNRLIREKSPYLLQHAHNPVDWYPWGEEALEKARDEDKPVFLSVGYSTCHWCHVMAHESFDNAEIAAILNRWFVSIKVDREERPDIDQLYMAATQAMTGSGGWPMSVFLFPDGKPFYAGTYFPPKSMYGRPGFADLLTAIHEAWTSRRSDLEDVAARLTRELSRKGEGGKQGNISPAIQDTLFSGLRKDFDPDFGGFGSAPKFPQPVQFNFLLHYWKTTGEPSARDMVLHTLRRMYRGGVYDHLGGGFHRYSTDRAWRVPHFEKMLYDQALLVSSYLDAYLVSGYRLFADAAADTCRYVLRDLTGAGGGFYSAEDADSEDPSNPGVSSEGAYYLWTEKEIFSLLPGRDARIFSFCYGISAAGNAPEDPHDEFKGKNILYRCRDNSEAADLFNLSETEIRRVLLTSRRLLFDARTRRKRPHLDDKILVCWNGLMIGALARAGIILGQPQWIEAAEKSAGFIRARLYAEENGILFRRYRQEERGLAGQLDDYAFLVAGLLNLHQVTQNRSWLQWAVELTESQIRLFHDGEKGGFYDGVEDRTLPFRVKGDYDGAEPAPNSVAAMNLLMLGELLARDDWRRQGRETIEAFAAIINAQPQALPLMVSAWQLTQRKSCQIVIVGMPGRDDTRAMMGAVHSAYDPGKIVLLADNGPNQDYLAQRLPFMREVTMLEGAATAYVCEDFTCRAPVNSAEALEELLKNFTADRG
jgi:uncharacterized protein